MIPVASCFSQLLSLVDRGTFVRAVRQHQAARYKGHVTRDAVDYMDKVE